MLARRLLVPAVAAALVGACAAPTPDAAPGETSQPAAATAGGGEAAVADSTSEPHIAKIAAGSKDHTTLVAALKAAGLDGVLGTSGPFTVFAPVDAAFAALPKGTVEGLLQPRSKDELTAILQHHVTTSALAIDAFADGQTVTMVDGTPVTFTRKGPDTFVAGAKVVASIKASNGWIHVVDKVLVAGA